MLGYALILICIGDDRLLCSMKDDSISMLRLTMYGTRADLDRLPKQNIKL